MRTVGVVIPYFQRERGLLRRSVDSVIAQELPSNVRLNVVIVDDSSPWPARDELAEHPLLIRSELTIIKQPNGGPGAARNAALDFMSSEEIEYVAFLDSDDAWYPLHIATALEYLQGCDLYFDNTWEDERDFFSYSKYIHEKHSCEAAGVYEPPSRIISAHEAFDALLNACFVHTSQVVYNFSRYSDIRFAVDQGRAGEDYLFWLTLTSRCDQVAYSTTPMGSRGWGVSIYRDSLSWESQHALDSLIDALKLQQKIAKFADKPGAKRMLRTKRRQMRDRLMFLMMRDLPRRPEIVWKATKRLAKELPEFFVHVPASIVRMPAHIRMTRAKSANERLDQKVPA